MEILIKHPKYNREIKSYMPFPDMHQVVYILEELKLSLITGVVVKLLDTPFSYVREGMYWREVKATTHTYQIEDEEEEERYSLPQPPSNKPYKKSNRREKRKEKKSNYQYMGASDKALETPLEVDPDPDHDPEFDDSDRDNEPKEIVVEKTNGVDNQPLEEHKGVVGSAPVVTEKKEVFSPDKIPSKEYVKNEIFSFRK